jgi:hypothetical protein
METTGSDPSLFTIRFLDNHTAIAAGKNNDRIHFLNKTLFYAVMHGIGL